MKILSIFSVLSIFSTLTLFSLALPTVAQVASTAARGDQSHQTNRTGAGGAKTTALTFNQQKVMLQTTTRGLASVFGGGSGMRDGLPGTTLDSFVHEAAGNAELIYGDEGAAGLPPYESFTYEHRINNGIYDQRKEGLTTGHGSYMPSAWGNDEFLGAEFSQSGAGSGSSDSSNGAVGSPGTNSTSGSADSNPPSNSRAGVQLPNNLPITPPFN